MSLTQYIRLLRPQQWVKNVFVFMPLFFDNGINDIGKLSSTVFAFLAFCMVASSIYCFNDIHDREADMLHARKRLRPIASGAVSVTSGYVLMGVCLMVSIALCLPLGCAAAARVASVIAIYFIINIAYCLWLKRKAIVDVFCISIGFVLRIVAGGFASDVTLSRWIVLMTFLIALFMAFAKRRDDVVSYNNTGIVTRQNIVGYNLSFMDMTLAIIAAVTMMCYVMYTIDTDVVAMHQSQYLYITSIFVLAALIRYLQLTIVYERSGSPTDLVLHDSFLQACLALWLMSFVIIIYVRI